MSRANKKRGRARAKAARERSKAAARERRIKALRPAKTEQGKNIQSLVLQAGGHPNDYKDYVVITGNRMMDWKDAFNVSKTDGKAFATNAVMVLHKSKLHGIVPPRVADMFWNKALGTRVVKSG